jgi:hypothetical protein
MNKKTNRLPLTKTLAGFALVAAVLTFAGCKSSDTPYSSSFASVEIKDKQPKQIRDAILAVFKGDGYTLAGTTSEYLVFEEEGSRMDKIAYGNWVGETPVYVRVKVSMVSMAEENTWRLSCNAYMVRNKGDMLVDEVKLPNRKSRPFQNLLNKVADRLETQP